MKAWLHAHRKAAGEAARRLAGAPLGTLLGALVIGIALALPAGGELLLANLARLSQSSAAAPQLSLFMAVDAGHKDVAELEARLRRHEGIRELRFVPRDEALRRLKAGTALGEVIDSLPANPLPDAFVVIPRSNQPEAVERLRLEVARYPRVEHAQLDSSWVTKLDALLGLGRTAISFLAGLLGVALVAVTFNTIRLQILTQGAEIELSQLLGATDGFIRRPFHYFGALQGLAGGLVAWAIVLAGALLLRNPVAHLAALYGIQLAISAPSWVETLALLGFATSLGWLGAQLSLRRHLHQQK